MSYLLRKTQMQQARSTAPCKVCGHPHFEHREYGYTNEIQNGALVEVVDPRHEPGKFACHIEGCNCEIRA